MSILKRAILAYIALNEKHPFKTISISTSVILGTGDLLMQFLEKLRLSKEEKKQWKIDFKRMFIMGEYGLTFGVFCYFWYTKWLPKLVYARHQTKTVEAIKKVFLDETLQSWYYYITFLYFMTRLSGGSHQEGLAKIKKDFWRIYFTDLKFWPIIQFGNFYLVPNHMQAFVVSVVSVFWAAYLSYVQNN